MECVYRINSNNTKQICQKFMYTFFLYRRFRFFFFLSFKFIWYTNTVWETQIFGDIVIAFKGTEIFLSTDVRSNGSFIFMPEKIAFVYYSKHNTTHTFTYKQKDVFFSMCALYATIAITTNINSNRHKSKMLFHLVWE